MSEIRQCPTCGADLPAGAADQPCPACLMKLALQSAEFVSGSDDRATERYVDGFAPPTVESLAPRFPQLELLELVGKGGMGAVYRARQKSLDRIVAVKIINPDAARQPGFAERFAREARAMARLNHPNIVTIHDFGQTSAALSVTESDGAEKNPLYYLVMEYVEGTNLRGVLREKRLTPAEALEIVPHLCDALQYAHDEGIVHRDIKPENILIDKKGRVKIADFGLAKLLGQTPREITLTESHHALGTLHYMAPEQLERPLEVDHRADIYALGVTFYEMLTGELPIGRFALPSQKARIDVRLDEIVLRALEREPERRYQHASDVKTAVESCVDGHSSITNTSESVRETSKRLRAPAYAMIAYGAVALTLVAVYLAGSMVEWQNDRLRETFAYMVGPGSAIVVGLALSVPAGYLAITAGLRMLECRSFGLVATAAILVMVPFTPFVLGFPIGIWVLIAINQTSVRAAFEEVARRSVRSVRSKLSSQQMPAAFAPGVAPRMLVLMLGTIASVLLALVGAGLITYSVAIYTAAGAERWSWYFGCGCGSLLGGMFGALACWNQSRVMRGRADFMTDPRWNSYDTVLLAYGLLGVAGLAATAIGWTSIDFWPRVAALIFGGVAALQGIGVSVWRHAVRRAAAERPEQPAPSLQMILVAVSIFACGMLVVGGVVLLAYSVMSLPAGTLKFWAGIGSAMTWLFGGGFGLLVTWNLYRSLEGLPSWMTENNINLLDRSLIATAGYGISLMVAGIIAAPSITATSVSALELIGGVLASLAGVFIGIRSLMRRAARQAAERNR